MSLRLVVSDMVGTTVQAGDEVPSAFRGAFRVEGIELSDEEIAGIRGRSKRDAISDLLERHSGGPSLGRALGDGIYARFQGALKAAYRGHASAIAGAEGAIRRLREAQIEVVLTTGLGRDVAELLVESLGWGGLGLSGLVTGDDVERGRPYPDLIHAAMHRVGIRDPRAVLVMGDTTADLDAAAAAGVGWSIGVLSGAHTRSVLESRACTALLLSVAELPDWIEREGLLVGLCPPESGKAGPPEGLRSGERQ